MFGHANFRKKQKMKEKNVHHFRQIGLFFCWFVFEFFMATVALAEMYSEIR